MTNSWNSQMRPRTTINFFASQIRNLVNWKLKKLIFVFPWFRSSLRKERVRNVAKQHPTGRCPTSSAILRIRSCCGIFALFLCLGTAASGSGQEVPIDEIAPPPLRLLSQEEKDRLGAEN